MAFLVSAVSALLLYAVLIPVPWARSTGTASRYWAGSKAHVGAFTGWALLQWLLVLVVTLIHPALVLIVAAPHPVPPHRRHGWAAQRVGGQLPHPRRQVLAVAAHLGDPAHRGVIFFLLAAVDVFFIKGTPAAVFFWLAIGLVAWWLLTAWTLVYRAARHEDEPSA